jgi:hypothetical protein
VAAFAVAASEGVMHRSLSRSSGACLEP